MSTTLLLLLILACPLMMVFMMRGMHGGHGQAAKEHDHDGPGEREHGHSVRCRHDDESLEDLTRRRDELDEQIAAREHEERVGVGA